MPKESHGEIQIVEKDFSCENLNSESGFLGVIREPNFLSQVCNKFAKLKAWFYLFYY